MAKLTRAQTATLETTLYHLKRAQRYLTSEKTAVCRRDTMASTTLHYSRADGKALYEVEKEIGSDLTGLADGIRQIERLLNPIEVEVAA